MDFEKIKGQMKEITEIASSVPDPFKERCFQILLETLLAEQKGTPTDESTPSVNQPPPASFEASLPIPTQVKIFMARTKVTERELNSIMFYGENQAHFIKEPGKSSNAQAQMEWALLLALKHAIEFNEFLADPEEVRSVCKAKDCYDAGNFARHFKFATYERWFKEALEPQGQPQPLRDEGLFALGDLVRKLAGANNEAGTS